MKKMITALVTVALLMTALVQTAQGFDRTRGSIKKDHYRMAVIGTYVNPFTDEVVEYLLCGGGFENISDPNPSLIELMIVIEDGKLLLEYEYVPSNLGASDTVDVMYRIGPDEVQHSVFRVSEDGESLILEDEIEIAKIVIAMRRHDKGVNSSMYIRLNNDEDTLVRIYTSGARDAYMKGMNLLRKKIESLPVSQRW